MTRDEGRALLNRARDGDPTVTRHQITAALIASGDLDEDGRPFVLRRAPGAWERTATDQSLALASWLGPIA